MSKDLSYYKKKIIWKKEPNWDAFITGLIFIACACLMLTNLILINPSTTILTFIFTSMFLFGIRQAVNHCGEGKEIYFEKLKGGKKVYG